jgi:hypothetical protein
MSPDQVLIIIAMVTAAWTATRIIGGPLGQALARRIGGPVSPGAEQVHELEDLRARVAELEERQDFTERVLLQERQSAKLGEGDGT